ncbi:MAG TPA: TonB-dependent receptor [Cyclobacteriaceae bacterium]
MEKFYKRMLGPLLVMVMIASSTFAQTKISGTVKDAVSGEPLAGANIIVKGTIFGTITNPDGNFELSVKQAPPVTLVFSFIGFKSQEIEVTDANTSSLQISMDESTELDEVVVSGTTIVEQSVMVNPVTVEKMNLRALKETPAAEYFDVLKTVKGVQTSEGSFNFPAVNTRGFATIANVRFVQQIDGMDASAPLLNFPTGNIVGISELDAESMELVPGPSSALYGPNAFNGILLMQSKSPFKYQGLSAQFKTGVTTSDAQGSAYPMFNFGVRYAKAFMNNKLAVKVNFSIMDAEDWRSNDYRTDRNNPESQVDLSGNPDFDGLNLYGDETPVPAGIATLKRTGFKEEDILDAYSARSMKYDAAIHYRITEKLEASYNYRFGGGNSIYQGTEKYALRDFTQEFHKVELKGSNFFVRGYLTATDAGDSYNLSALGGYMNETYAPTATVWAPDYLNAYNGYAPGVAAGDHAAARAYADRNRPLPGTQAFKDLTNQVRNQLFQGTPPGASFVDNSRLWHGQFNYDATSILKVVELQVGGNFRRYDLYSDATVFNEDPDGDSNAERIVIDEYGAFVQAAKAFGPVKFTGSIRYDKNENFDGQVTPRIGAVYTLNDNHFLRASFQTGFRNPDTQASFIYFPSSSGTLLGSTEANAARYGVHNGGAWTQSSYNTFRSQGGTLDPTTGAVLTGNASLLETADVPYVQPEQLTTYEVGYKGQFDKLFVDLNGYYNVYNDFIGGQIVASKTSTTQKGAQVNAGSLYSLYANIDQEITSYGIGLGLSYDLFKGYTVSGNYNFADVEENQDDENRAGFNTPNHKFNIALSNRKLTENLGFSINYRWQDSFLWESSYGTWNVPEFGVFDAQVSYKVSSIKSTVKLGGNNILGGDYRTNLGSPFVGQIYYISITFDQFFNK